MKHLVIFSGAGMSAESGISTFRDSNGLWEQYRIEDVATPEAWKRDPELVLEFYNARRKNVMEVEPNEAHLFIKTLENDYNVSVVTQNIDDLHERAGSSNVLHLHGEIMYGKNSEGHPEEYEYLKSGIIRLGDKARNGSQLRPHVVWFGESVPMLDEAAKICAEADIFVVIGSSLQVYPAAGLVHSVPLIAEKYIIDPQEVSIEPGLGFTKVKASASEGLQRIFRD